MNSRELLKFVVRRCPNKHVHRPAKEFAHASRSSSRWRTRAWAQALVRGAESDAARRFEAYPGEDAEMGLAGTAVPDDEFHEEPQPQQPGVLEEVPIAVRLAVMSIHKKNWYIPAKNCCAALCGLVEPMGLHSEPRVNSSVMFAWRTDLTTCHLPAKLADPYTEFNQGVGVDLFVSADSDEQVVEFLNMVDLATRFNICCPVPFKRPDDVLSVLDGLDKLGRSRESLDLGHGR